MKRIVFIATIAIMGYGISKACTNFLVTKGASTDGSTMITYAADSHTLYGELYYTAAAKHAKGDSLKIYEWDTGKFLGKIKQVKETFRVVGNMNQFQVAIGETTYGGRKELVDTTGIMDYGSLIYVTLQRAKTAREAIQIMTDLVDEYGYYSSGESFSIADKEEVWIMEMIGKGPGNKGAVWVALRIPDGYISGHANQARITTFPKDDPENCLYAPDVISFAREQGYYEGTDEDFSFSDTYAPLDFGGARFCEARVYAGFNKVNSEMKQFERYAMGFEMENRMPLWIKPDEKLSVQDVMGMMRDYYAGTPMDMTQDIGAGANANIVRWRPLTWEVDGKTYFNERAISTQQTGFSFVSQSRSWLPDAVGGILWFGVDDTYSTVYTPMFCGITEVPHAFEVGNGNIMEFSEDAAFWVFNQVSNLAYTRYNLMIPFIQEKQKALEDEFVAGVKEIEEKAKSLKKEEELLALVTDYSLKTGQKTLDEWKQMYRFLFTRYLDGNVKSPAEVPENYLYVEPILEQPGYSEEWYKRVVKETGEKFIYPEEETH
ncbi:MAG TPA: dipeptidase [Bacteroidales bacterium]|jgi:dipeptidase|nr:dipeptidase [Bacteroidales bacterium]